MATHEDSKKQTVEIGGLRFEVMHRSLQDDGGPTIEVYGDIDGESTQVLRFDCFRKAPHYHMPPGSSEVMKLSRAVDREALAAGWTQVRDAVAATAPVA